MSGSDLPSAPPAPGAPDDDSYSTPCPCGAPAFVWHKETPACRFAAPRAAAPAPLPIRTKRRLTGQELKDAMQRLNPSPSLEDMGLLEEPAPATEAAPEECPACGQTVAPEHATELRAPAPEATPPDDEMAGWDVLMICCGRDDGVQHCKTWEEANAFRDSYLNGPGVATTAHDAGHQRYAIVRALSGAAPVAPAASPPDLDFVALVRTLIEACYFDGARRTKDPTPAADKAATALVSAWDEARKPRNDGAVAAPFAPGRCPSGAHLNDGLCVCTGASRLEAEVVLLKRDLAAAEARAEAAGRTLSEVRDDCVATVARERNKLIAEANALSAEVSRERAAREAAERHILADEERRKLTGDALQAEGEAAAARSEAEGLRAALTRAANALERAKEALNHDRTGLAAGLSCVVDEVAGRYWMRPEGGWASYSWEEHTSDTLRKEINWAFNAILKYAKGALRASGNLAGVEVNAAHDALLAARAALAAASQDVNNSGKEM